MFCKKNEERLFRNMQEWELSSSNSTNAEEKALKKEHHLASKKGQLKGVRPKGRPYNSLYFRTYYPTELLLSLLNCNANSHDLLNRELSFSFANKEGEVYMIRYKSFKTTQQLRDFIRDKEPLRIDVGCFGYEPSVLWRKHKPQRECFGDFERNAWYEGELVLDIDLKDYDDVRTCNCTGARIYDPYCPDCKKMVGEFSTNEFETMCDCTWKKFGDKICLSCWKFAQCAMVVLDYLLRHKWGLKDFFFVFSGGKGFHCWIVDEHVRSFDSQTRLDFVGSFQPWVDKDRNRLKTENLTYDPIFDQDFENYLTFIFKQIILTQDIFDIRHVKTRTKILSYFNFTGMTSETRIQQFMKICEECVTDGCNGLDTWNRLMEFNDTYFDEHAAFINRRKFVYGYTFPRIDVEVTAKIRHLKKAPFSLHPQTQCVAVPLLPHSIETMFAFNPKECPNSTKKQAIYDSLDAFRYALAMLEEKLENIVYCEKDFPDLPLLNELAQQPVNEIFKKMQSWCKDNIRKETLFMWEEDYVNHAMDCEVCDHRIFLDRRNTLSKLVNRSSWIDDMFITTVEEALKLCFLDICSQFGFLALEKCITDRIQHLIKL